MFPFDDDKITCINFKMKTLEKTLRVIYHFYYLYGKFKL